MLKLFFIAQLALGTIFSTSLYAAECSKLITGRCVCKAPMLMRCGSVTGNVKADAQLKYIKIKITSTVGSQREVTLKNPPGGIRDYNAVNHNEWLKDNIKGLRKGDRLSVGINGYGLPDDTPLYTDREASSQVGTAGGKSSSSSDEMCFYDDELPLVMNYNSCSRKICSAKIKCNLPGGEVYEGEAMCPALRDGSCPSATDCANDEEISFQSPYNRNEIQVRDSMTGRAMQK